jgi:hypothetical protein
MATTTTNYGFDIPQSTDLVKDGATAIATLGQDIDTAMNTALGTKKAGMVLLNTTSFSGVSSQSVNDVFSATYDEYLIQLNGKGSTGAGVLFRLRASGSDATNATYNYQNFVASSTSVSGSRSNTQTSWDIVELTGAEKEAFLADRKATADAQSLLETEYKAKQKAREDAIKKLAEIAGLTEEEINAIL